VAFGANRDLQVKEDKAVDVAIAGPAQAPLLLEAMEECVPCMRLSLDYRSQIPMPS
jgi:hypothetical protein